MSFYERIVKKDIMIPECFDMTCGQAHDLNKNAESKWDFLFYTF